MGRPNRGGGSPSQKGKMIGVFVLLCAVITLAVLYGAYTLYEGDKRGDTAMASNNSNIINAPIGGRAWVTIEQSTKLIINGENSDLPLPMASTTKVVTAILACNSGKLQDVVSIPREACGIEGSSIYLKPNERIKLIDLVYGLMLRSGNDAATAIALFLGGSIDKFSVMMNDYAADCGAKNTNFVNPHGLHDSNHYTSAYDLALMTASALDNPDFRTIVSTKMHKIESEGEETRYLGNKNKMLTMYHGAIGVKTGYTKAAGRCLVGAANRDGVEVVSVVLNEPDMWGKTASNFDEGFRRVIKTQLLAKNIEITRIKVAKSKQTIGLCTKNNICSVTLDKTGNICYNIVVNEKLKGKIADGAAVGRIEFYRDAQLIANEVLYACNITSE